MLGKTWKHVWGHLSDDYSRRVIKNFLCKEEIARENRLNRAGIAAVHRAVSGDIRNRTYARFGGMVNRLYLTGKLIYIYTYIYISLSTVVVNSRD